MPELTNEIVKAWNEREGAVVLTTVDNNGIPNSIYATCVSLFENNKVLVADNYFDKTRSNLKYGAQTGSFFYYKRW